MPSRKLHITTGEFYHIYNRGVDKRKIFKDDRDRYRFIHDLYEFNDSRPVVNMARLSSDEYALATMPERIRKPRKMLVDIVAYALMPNHYHLLLRQLVDNGIPLFMQKIGTGYTTYFNERQNRSGSLFQGKYKAKHVDKDNYLRHLISYIHANPAALFRGRLEFDKYRWSSYLDYAGTSNGFPSLIGWEIVDSLGISRGKEHSEDVSDYISGKSARLIEKYTFDENPS